MTFRFACKTVICFLLFVSCSLSGKAAEVRFRQTAHCSGPLVLLEDVAEVFATDSSEAEFLKELELFPAPGPGESKTVRARDLRDLIVNRGGSSTNLRYQGSATITIRGSDPTAAVAANASGTRSSASGTQGRFRRPSDSSQEIRQVVVTTRPMRQGEHISSTDVTLVEVQGPPEVDVFEEPADLIGLETSRSIGEGKVLKPSLVRSPRLVQKNELVTVFVRAPGIRVRTTGRAMDDGSQGDLVRVQSLENRSDRMTARVVAIKEVEIFARGASVPATPNAPEVTANRYSRRLLRIARQPASLPAMPDPPAENERSSADGNSTSQ